MKKRIFSRVLALFMALSLLSTTAFAASFANLQDAINGNDNGTLIEGTEGHYGYGSYIEGSGYEITAWSIAAEGNTPANRVVNLWSDVNFSTGDKGIVIDGNKTGQENVTINMNGNTIDANPDAILDAKADGYGKFYQATTDENGEKVAVEDENGNKTVATDLNNVRILEVKNGANVTVNGEGGILTGGNLGTITVKDDGSIKGSQGVGYAGSAVSVTGSTVTMTDVDISGNRGAYYAGGAYAGTGSTFSMTGGSIKNNYSTGHGGGFGTYKAEDVALNNVKVSDNANNGHGGGIYTIYYEGKSAIEIDGCTFSENYSGSQGGGIYGHWATLDLTNTTIKDNTSKGRGGGIATWGATTISLKGNTQITGNSAHYGGGVSLGTGALKVTGTGNEIYGNTATLSCNDANFWSGIILEGMSLLNQRELREKTETGEDGHRLTGWYNDPKYALWGEDKVNTPVTIKDGKLTSDVYLKYAHNKLYTVTLHPGYENAGDPVALPGEVGQDLPTVNDPTPRPGYDFAGWVIADENGNPTDEKFDPTAPNDNGEDIVLVATWTASSSDDNNDNSGSTDTTIPGVDIPLGDLPTGGADAATTTIEDEETPLAGLFTRADAIGYLWEQTGSPEAELSDFADVPEDHYWAVAIGWAQDMGIALPDEEGNFRPDDLVLRTSDEPEGELQEFLNRYAVFAGVELEDGELFIELDGTAEDFIMGEEAQVIFDEFFAKLEAALATQAA